MDNYDERKRMYHAFRNHIDELAFETIKTDHTADYVPIEYDGKEVGFMLVIKHNGYVEAIWVDPEYRGKGLGHKAVRDYIANGGFIGRLVVLRNNPRALKFWKSLFTLAKVTSSVSDVLYACGELKPEHRLKHDKTNC